MAERSDHAEHERYVNALHELRRLFLLQVREDLTETPISSLLRPQA